MALIQFFQQLHLPVVVEEEIVTPTQQEEMEVLVVEAVVVIHPLQNPEDPEILLQLVLHKEMMVALE